MSYLRFLDESGHDHRNTPYEVRGGIVLHASKVWPFVQGLRTLEEASFGTTLQRYGSELKGAKLLNRDRFKWAQQGTRLEDEARRKAAIAFLVMDETEKTEDRRFVGRMERYFTRTQPGRIRSGRIVPTPFFVASDMAYPVQAADICLYCLNWGFRLPQKGMAAPIRQEVADEFASWIGRLQLRQEVTGNDGAVHTSFGICYVPDLYGGK